MKLLWGRPQAPKLDSEGSDEAKQQAAVTHSGLLPRAVISQQQNQPLQAPPPGAQTQPPPMPYFNIPPLPQHERAYYPSMDPQRMGALIRSQEGPSSGSSGSNENRSGSEQQHQQAQQYGYPSMVPPRGQFYPPYYPQYGHMGPPPPVPPSNQHYPQQYQGSVPAAPPPPATGTSQQP